ncbi:hypothetical protein H1C71_041952 [Ictidomys tridecemlineatus]|nr:hypothetical protein H1C71_041952 [Ictidomys tridecemlineatus]KAG3294931.1 hypothetical protein H1C71_041952 [Ictidomys tridecemlineatus]
MQIRLQVALVEGVNEDPVQQMPKCVSGRCATGVSRSLSDRRHQVDQVLQALGFRGAAPGVHSALASVLQPGHTSVCTHFPDMYLSRTVAFVFSLRAFWSLIYILCTFYF